MDHQFKVPKVPKISKVPNIIPVWRPSNKRERERSKQGDKKHEKKLIFGSPIYAPIEIRWLHSNLSLIDELIETIQDEDFRKIRYAADLNIIAAYRQYNFKASTDADIKPLNQRNEYADHKFVKILGGYLVSLFSELPKGTLSEFTKISYKNLVESQRTKNSQTRRMLAEYEMHASNFDPCMRDEEGMACKELKEMELLRMMMRIILDAFESIYQRIQVIQFKMNKELSQAIDEQNRRKTNYLIANKTIEDIRDSLPSTKIFNDYNHMYNLMPRVHLIRAYWILQDYTDVILHTQHMAAMEWETFYWKGDKKFHDECFAYNIESLMNMQLEAYRLLDDDNGKVIENHLYNREPTAQKIDEQMNPPWGDAAFNAPDRVLELGDWSQLEKATDTALKTFPISLVDFGNEKDFQAITYKLLEAQTDAIRKENIEIFEREIKKRRHEWFHDRVTNRDEYKTTLPALFLNDQHDMLNLLKYIDDKEEESNPFKLTDMYTKMDERRRLWDDLPEQWHLLRTELRSLVSLRNGLIKLPLGAKTGKKFKFRLDTICANVLMEKAKMLRMMKDDEGCDSCIDLATDILEEVHNMKNKHLKRRLNLLNILTLESHQLIISLLEKYNIERSHMYELYSELVDDREPYRLLIGSPEGTRWFRASAASKIAFLLGNIALKDNSELFNDKGLFFGLENTQLSLDYKTTEEARGWFKRACKTAELCRPGDNFQKRKCYYAMAELNDEFFRQHSTFFFQKNTAEQTQADLDASVLSPPGSVTQGSQLTARSENRELVDCALNAIEKYGQAIVAGHRLDRMCLFKIIELVFHVADALGEPGVMQQSVHDKSRMIFARFEKTMNIIPPEQILTIITQILGRLSHRCKDFVTVCFKITLKMTKVFPYQMTWYFLNFSQHAKEYEDIRKKDERELYREYQNNIDLWERKGKRGMKPVQTAWSEMESKNLRSAVVRGRKIYMTLVKRLISVDEEYKRIFRHYSAAWTLINEIINHNFRETPSGKPSLRSMKDKVNLASASVKLLEKKLPDDFKVLIPTKEFMRPKQRNTRLLADFDVNFSPFQTTSSSRSKQGKKQPEEDIEQTGEEFCEMHNLDHGADDDVEYKENPDDPELATVIDFDDYGEFPVSPGEHHEPEEDMDNDPDTYDPPIDTEKDTWKKPWHPNLVFITSFMDEILQLSSQQKPKRLVLLGTDGREHSFLLKRGDDLNLDSRIGETFELFDYLLRHDEESRDADMSIRSYNVLPIGHKRGIIEWVDDLWAFKKCLQAYYERRGYTTSQLFWSPPEFSGDGADRMKSFEEIKKKAGPPVFHEWFLESFPTAGEWYQARETYQRSLAVTSIIGSIIGLGDRHCDNLQICQRTGEVVHIDLNMIFLKGRNLKVPEIVPFRMTRNIVDGLGPVGVQGLFRKTALLTIRIAKDKGKLLRTVFSLVLRDPTCKWEKIRSKKNVLITSSGKDRSQESPIVLMKEKNMMREDRQAAEDLTDLLKRVYCYDPETKKILPPSDYLDLLVQTASADENLYKMYRVNPDPSKSNPTPLPFNKFNT
ncbi:Oidioi.mRNA.OKI2018_I69.chr2.g7195.t1.cds [Oikopleura dioica]|uniref:Oidioi.mRNA.OKI2018_I69.chr2.g7195.t1.cds n=1 Tax=Oikopleura dioica TaxID=34765 RepID=A0ABN7TC33_OIKDI|nr:Oidioi.mRNA.OKI2018_I69.chr2.g7195.t1.cds [Oikopleura dioica]